MSWLKRIFTTQIDSVEEIKVKTDFSIEHYPVTGRYYPKFGDNYLKMNRATGIVTEVGEYRFMTATYGTTKQEALEYIALFKEQKFKDNVVTIPVNFK